MPSTSCNQMCEATEWPITFRGWWQDGDQDDIPEPWETFRVMVHGAEAGDSRELMPADVPALLDALGIGETDD
jgi:hypothetical protein